MNALTWREAQFEIDCSTGKSTVNGKIFEGDVFGIDHRVVAEEDEYWVVTHLPTGTKFSFYFDREEQAKEFVYRVAPLADWKAATLNKQQLRLLVNPIGDQLEALNCEEEA